MSCLRVDPCVSETHCGFTSFHEHVITITEKKATKAKVQKKNCFENEKGQTRKGSI